MPTVVNKIDASSTLQQPRVWTVYPRCSNPKQTNSYDCGVFVITFMDLLMINVPLCFDQNDILQYRRKLTLKLLKQSQVTATNDNSSRKRRLENED